MAHIAIIGAGPAGSLCARVLADSGHTVSVLDKGRGAGGRLSTRRRGAAHFDHGAQFLTLRSPELAPYAAGWRSAGALAPWEGPFGTLGADGFRASDPPDPRWVGVPGMSGLVKAIQGDLPVQFGVRASKVEGTTVHLEDGSRREGFDRVVVAAPAPQAAALVEGPLSEALGAVRFAPCLVALLDLGADRDLGFAAARVGDGPLGWVARNQTKPGRPAGEHLVLHATPAWSREHLEEDPAASATMLWAALQRLVPGLTGAQPTHFGAHRWRYALVEQPVGQPFLRDGDVFACGDGLLGGRIEDALLSGKAAAEAVLASL